MRSTTLAAFLLPALLVSFSIAAPQTRTKKKEPVPFPELVAKATSAYGAADYRGCLDALEEASSMARHGWLKAIHAALPAAPEGFALEPLPEPSERADAGMLAGLAASIGTMLEARYVPSEGRGSIGVTVAADSPMVGMMAMLLGNPAMLNENQELIEYGDHKAILESGGRGLELQIVLASKHLVTVNGFEDEDKLFAMWDQAAIDRLVGVLGD